MKSKVIWVLISLLVAISMLLAACAKPAPTTTPTPPTTPTAPPPTKAANWWDKFGEPRYGGTIIYRESADMLGQSLDPYSSWGAPPYMETLWHPDWTVDRNIWSFPTRFIPDEYWAGNLAESWEQTDPLTLTVHLRKGVQWQNKPPVNGREFTAYDVQFHYDRIMGTGSGFTTPDPFHAARVVSWEKVTATDRYTVQFKFKYPTALGFLSITEISGQNYIEAPESVKMEGGLSNWRNGVGTGPWMLTAYVAGGSVTYTKNPNYWGYDDRHLNNRLPYADTLKVAIIPDIATALAAMRTGKIDFMTGVPWQQAQSLAKTNPELKQVSLPVAAQSACLRADTAPFTDIKVRKALQLAIDSKTIAKTHFGGTVDGTPCGLINPAISRLGYGFDYKDWTQELKDEYSYNPEKAKQLLEEAGYPTGFKTTLVAPSVGDTELMQIMQSELKDIGVTLDIQLMDMTAWMPLATGRKADQMCWDPVGKTGCTIPLYIAIANYYSTDMANFGNVNDPEYDTLVNQFNHAATIDEAKKLLKAADQRALEQHWALSACSTVSYNLWQPYLKGYSGEDASGWGGWFWSACWMDQDLKASMGH